MKAGFLTSTALHVGVLGYAMVSLAAPKPLSVPQVEALPIELVPIEAITKSVQGDRTATIETPPAPRPSTRPEPRPEAVNAGNTDNDRAADASESTPAPPVEETKAPTPAPEPAPRPEPIPKPEPVAKPEPAPEPAPKEKTDIALLVEKNQPTPEPSEPAPDPEVLKLPERVAAPKPRPKRPPVKKVDDRNVKEKATVNREKANAGGAKSTKRPAGAGTKRGNAPKLAQSEIDALRGRLETCWSVADLTGHPDAGTMRAQVIFKLTRSGDIDGRVRVKVSGTDRSTRATLAVRVRAAVTECAPYALPPEKYETWSEVQVNFSLADML
ncbi:MAG: hypothetical protein AAGK38_02470 [Pseudomonadota bacterium]